eukprot:scaffold218689_cov12-Tisochrysis_lutea.AAC.1
MGHMPLFPSLSDASDCALETEGWRPPQSMPLSSLLPKGPKVEWQDRRLTGGRLQHVLCLLALLLVLFPLCWAPPAKVDWKPHI